MVILAEGWLLHCPSHIINRWTIKCLSIKCSFLSLSCQGEDGKVNGTLQIGKAVGNSDVWFRFNEGVSNAVRRNVYIRELL